MLVRIYKINIIPYGFMTAFPDSQTIFGAICWAIRELYGEEELEQLLDNFKEHESRFIVSSSFMDGPFKASIMNWAKLDEIIEIGNRVGVKGSQLAVRSKSLKKIEYFSEVLFRDYLKGEIGRLDLVEGIISQNDKYELNRNILHYRGEEIPSIDYYEENVRRNFINRLSGTTDEGQLFYYKRIYITPNSKLYFLMKTENINYFLPVFKYMSDTGIGGDKSVGANSFKVSFESEFKYEKYMEENILLSKYIPYYEEVHWDKSFYSIIMEQCMVESRHEFHGEDIVKIQVGYIGEGSKLVLKQYKDMYARLPIVKEIGDKKIRHNGLAFFL